ncbi:MAG: hypothetical protein J5925_04730 [Clostridia bacterium]|nr:hypothetical protein [Clostridia bacterium]MBR4798827.1 hypothetical protein [Clostridia bacterium]
MELFKTGSKKFTAVHVPGKRSINLAEVGVKKVNYKAAIPAIIIIAVLAVLISKFGVIDRFVKVADAEREVAELQARIDTAQARIQSYGELRETYAHYTYSDMTEEELNRADRVGVMELLKRVVMPKAAISTWSVSGNQLKVMLNAGTLEEINGIAQSLMDEPTVDYCTISTAVTDKDYVETAKGVTANIIVYLTKASEEEVSGS